METIEDGGLRKQTRGKALKRDWRKLTKQEQIAFYKSLVTSSFAEASRDIGLDLSYGKSSLRTVGYKIYQSLDPKELGFSDDMIEMVVKAIEGRRVRSNRTIVEKDDGWESTELLDPKDSKQMVIGGRNKAAILLHKKMDRLNKHPKLLEGVSLTQLSTTFSILFDKSQIITGQATENIAVMAKIDPNLTPEQSLDMILAMREKQAQDK